MSKVNSYLMRFHGVVDSTSSLVNIVGMVGILGLMVIITVDVILRNVFKSPVPGTMDLIVAMLATVVFSGMAYTASKKGHISVDFLTARLKPTAQSVLDSVTGLLVAIMLGLIVWQSIMQAQRLFMGGQASAALNIPVWPFLLVVAFCTALFLLVVIANLSSTTNQALERGHRGALSGLVVGGLLALLLCIAVAMRLFPWEINPVAAGLISFPILIAVLLTGMPVGCVLLLLGFLGMSFVRNLGSGLGLMGMIPYDVAASYSYVVIPLFVLMGEFVFVSGLGQDLFSVAYKWLGRFPGGLASATVAACAGFAAVCGSIVATAAAMATVTLPEMKKYKYDPSLATGTVAAGGTLGTLIPPSVTFVLYGIVTQQSIGRLFIAGILPGLLLTSLFIISIYTRCRRNPNLGPVGSEVSFSEKVTSLKGIWPILVLFLLVIGGIYWGVFSPDEAAGIGAFGALIIGLAKKRINRQSLSKALLSTGQMTSMTFLLLIGSAIFGSFLAVSRVPFVVADYVSGLSLSKIVIFGGILSIYFVLGSVMSSLPILVLVTPIVFPSVMALGFDPIWFGVIVVIMCEMGTLTPPVGITVYIVAGVAKDVPLSTVFRGVMPFILMEAVCLALLFAFPQIALFLPHLIKG